MKTTTCIAALALAGVTLTATASSASAADARPCVSKVEYRQTPGAYLWNRDQQNPGPALTRRALEREWEVVGLGYDDGTGVWVYPACGYAPGVGEIWVVPNQRDIVNLANRWVYGVPNGNV